MKKKKLKNLKKRVAALEKQVQPLKKEIFLDNLINSLDIKFSQPIENLKLTSCDTFAEYTKD